LISSPETISVLIVFINNNQKTIQIKNGSSVKVLGQLTKELYEVPNPLFVRNNQILSESQTISNEDSSPIFVYDSKDDQWEKVVTSKISYSKERLQFYQTNEKLPEEMKKREINYLTNLIESLTSRLESNKKLLSLTLMKSKITEEELNFMYQEHQKKQYEKQIKEIVQSLYYLKNTKTESVVASHDSIKDKLSSLYNCSRLSIPTPQEINQTQQKLSTVTDESSPDFPLRAIQEILQGDGIQLVLKDSSSDVTDYNMHLFCSADIGRKAWEASLPESSSLNYAKLISDEKEKDAFITTFQNQLSSQLNVNPKNIVILGLERGSIRVIFQIIDPTTNNIVQTVNQNNLQTALNQVAQNLGLQPQVALQLHPFFTHCSLSPTQTDPKGNFDFTRPQVQNRGGFKYFQPGGWKRYGLKVVDKYLINGQPNNDWLRMDNKPGEWTVGFHGTQSPESVNGIVNTPFIPGGGAFMGAVCTRTNQRIGPGVYFSPHIETAEAFTNRIAVGNKNYIVAFQCRLNPPTVLIPAKQSDIVANRGNPDWDNDYWVVHNPVDIRPYGILLKKV